MPREKAPFVNRHTIPILVAPAVTGIGDGTGALTLVNTLVLGYTARVEKIRFISGSIATGSGATQTYKLRVGGATGTVVATLTLTLATVNAVGKYVEASVAAADSATARFNDLTGLSLTRDSGGTAFTKLEGIFEVVVAQKPQARR